jgi:ketosteroid isomerase-like protein
MSNLATVQSIYDAFGKGDVPTILEMLADDVEWESWVDNSSVRAGVPWMTPLSGRENVARFFEVAGQFEMVDLQVLSFLEGGNQVAVEFVIEVRLPGWGGRSFRDEEIHLWTFDNTGKVSRLRHYTDTAKQIAAFAG